MREPVPSKADPNLLAVHLGSVLLFTDGLGLYTTRKGGVPCEITVELDPDIEVNEDCQKIDFAHSYFTIVFVNGAYDPEGISHPYTDKRFIKGVEDYLALLNLPTSVGWSERGRQTSDGADLDCGDDLLEALFPQTFADARARKLAERPAMLHGGRIEYSVTSERFTISAIAEDGTVVARDEFENDLNPPRKITGDYSMTSIAIEEVGRWATRYQVEITKKVSAE